jgi:TolA-binding protein
MSGIKRRRFGRLRIPLWGVLTLASLLIGVAALPGQLTPDQAADLILNSARRGYNDKSYTFATGRFREFLAKFSNHAKAADARYGLALSLINGPARDYAGAAEQLQQLAGNTAFPDHAFVLYYLGVARRGMGVKQLALPQQQAAANQQFDAAAKHFEAAVKVFTAKAKKPDPKAKELSDELEWAALARCDQAEMLVRLLKAKEAQAAAAPFLKDDVLVKSRYRRLGLYYHGLACVRLKEYPVAAGSLRQLAPFTNPVHGVHARYLLADCLLQQAPARTGDPGPVRKQLRQAAELLDGFISAQPRSAQTPDALLKLGVCYQRLADLEEKPRDRLQLLADARSTYERLMREFAKDPLLSQAVYERARCLAQSGRQQAAATELRRFRSDPLKNGPVAPLALLELSRLLRGQNKAEEAAQVLAECRQQHEPALLRDPGRSEWVIKLQFHHGSALREAGKLAPAAQVFDGLIRQFPNRPDSAEAALCRGQCLKEEALAKIESARKTLASAGLKPPDQANANRLAEEGYRLLQPAVQYLADQANQLKQAHPAWEVRARMLYESAWGYRELAVPEVSAARARVQQDRLKKMQEEAARKNPNQKPPAPVALPEVAWAEIPLQPSEGKARAQYMALIEDKDFAGLTLAGEARVELAELLSQRQEYAPALQLLQEALTRDLHVRMADRFRVQVGLIHVARRDFKAALVQFDAVAKNSASPQAGRAQYHAGECLMARKDYAGAAERWAVFRDRRPFRNIAGWTDRALLRMGHAYEQLGDWEKSRQAYELLAERFPASPWVRPARYGIAFTWQHQKQYDKAITWYTRVAAADDTETAAKAQFQIGLCRHAQKRYGEAVAAFLLVPFGYDYPDWSAAALCEAARALAADGKTRQADRILRRVLKDYPQSQWAAVARERLGK